MSFFPYPTGYQILRESSVSAEGRSHQWRSFSRTSITIKIWQRPETAQEKSLERRVFFLGMDNTTVSFINNLIKSVTICFKVVCLLATR